MVLNKQQIEDYIKELAKSQGFYGRLLNQTKDDPSILTKLEEQHFNSILDMVLYLEC